MKQELILKALEGYSGAFRAKIIWGVDFDLLNDKDKNNYTQKMNKQKINEEGKYVAFKPHEINSIISFLASKKHDFDAVLNCG